MHEHTTAEIEYLAANERFYRLDWLIYVHRRLPTGSPHVVRHCVEPKDYEAIRRAARKVAKAETKAPWMASDNNPFIVQARAELREKTVAHTPS